MSSGIELSVRKGSGSALPELYIALGIQRGLSLSEGLHLLRSLLYGSASLKDQRHEPGFGKNKTCEHSCRPEPCDDRPQTMK